MEKVVEKRQVRYQFIKDNEVPEKLDMTENQRKVIKDKYLKDAPSHEAWLRGVAKNIALSELLNIPEYKKKIFKGVHHEEVVTKSKKGKDTTTFYVHPEGGSPKEMDKNFKKLMANMYQLVKEDAKAAKIVKEQEDLFFGMMARWDFLPNSPTLMNAGRDLQQLSACYVLPIEDSVAGWGDTVKNTMLIHKSGGGTGFSGCRVRPSGAMVKSTKGVASGPLSVFKMVDAMTEQIKQGGTRRGANMGILPYWHPDIIRFITCKNDSNYLENFNISVAIDDKFMKAVKNEKEIELVNPKDNSVMDKINAKEIWDLMIDNAWATGDPGFVVIDRINASLSNPTPELGQIESTNPCVTGDTLVTTDRGLIPIEKLADSSNIYVDVRAASATDNGLLLEQLGTTLSKATAVWETGVKETFRVETKSGYELEATSNHKIMTNFGWKTVAELTTDDKVLIQSAEGGFPLRAELPVSYKNTTEWSRELGQALGWLVGDGWLREGRDARAGFCFGNKDYAILEYLKPYLNGLYGKDIKEVLRNNNTIHLSYHSKPFVNFFKALGVKPVKAEMKEVPNSIFTASKPAVQGFLQGLFTADGTIGTGNSNNTNYIRLTSKSKRLLKGVQILLLNLGTKSRIYNRSRLPRDVFTYKDKKGKLRVYESDGVLYELQISRDSIPVFLSKIGFLRGRHFEKIRDLERVSFYSTEFEDQVVSIKSTGLKKVYDLSEPITNSFIGNGFVVHNCGEQPLLPYEPCNLGSINLSNFVIEGKNPKIDWDRLGDIAQLATHFLDNVIDVNNYPLQEIERMAKSNRRIGLGVMGWAEMLSMLQIPYNSDNAFKLADEIMMFINESSMTMSVALGKERGLFPNWENSIYDSDSKHYRGTSVYPRNCAKTTIAPTGTIGITAGLQGAGIEPFFAIVYTRYNAAGIDALKQGETPTEEQTFYEVNNVFQRMAKENDYFGMEKKELYQKVVDNHGSLIGIPEIPKDVQMNFLTSHDLSPDDHVNVQAAFQRHTDNGVSKTVNLRNEATVEDVRDVYELAYNAGVKGVTIYRDGSKGQQVLNLKKEKKEEKATEQITELIEEVEEEVKIVDAAELVPAQGNKHEKSTYYKIKTGYGPVHIHINHDDKGPTRVFANISPTGTEISGLTSALAIILSKYFALGGDPKRILKHLNSVKGDKPLGFGAKRIDSIPHALSVALKDHLVVTGKLENTQTTLSDEKLVKYANDLYCTQCYSSNVALMSGCSEPTCFDCGHSKCG
ncbi:LAGLIDADG family homing endonuclease [Nanoarchaeota archaeon]